MTAGKSYAGDVRDREAAAEGGKPEPGEASLAHRAHWIRLLLLLPFIAMLWVSSYDDAEPRLLSVPFFYWYQMLWVLLSAAIIGIVYLVEHSRGGR